MINKKRIKDWSQTSDHRERTGPIPRPPQLREACLWLLRRDAELFFVNGSCEPIDRLATSMSAVALVDDGVFACDAAEIIQYDEIVPDEAVKIDEYDDFYDLDYLLGATILIEAGRLGRVACYVPGRKGGIHEQVLRWKGGPWHARVVVEPLESPC